MVGFPGETDREFLETAEFIRSHPFGYLHLFPFSPRPGTPGWDLHRQFPVPKPAVRERMATLQQLAAEKSCAHRSSFLGRALQCLTLHSPASARAQGRTLALSENFLPVELQGSLPPNLPVVAQVTALGPANLLAGSAHL
jgi:threonylcarbamoyladenosine tRNA methylthiotransferase MtaB